MKNLDCFSSPTRLGHWVKSLAAFRIPRLSASKSLVCGVVAVAALAQSGLLYSQTAQTLPYSANPGISSLTSANGWTYTGIGSDYADTLSKVKFDTSADVATLRIASTPGTVSFYLKGNSLSGSYVFDLLESPDGTTFTTARTVTSGIPNTNTTYSQALLSTTRYIRWRYTTKASGNIGMGTISITDGAAPPTVTTGTASSISTSGATLEGNITATGSTAVSERGVYYSTTDGFANGTGTKVSDLTGGFGTGVFTQDVTTLDAGTTYYYKAFATNGNGTGYGSQGSFITVPAAPAMPTASAVTSSGFTVTWDAVTGAASYRLDVATDSGFTTILPAYDNLTVSGTSQALASLDPTTTYHVRVRAVNAGGTGAASATLTQATDAATSPVITLSPGTLTGFSVVYGAGASPAQSFGVTGTNLSPASGDITVTATGLDYEVSSDNSTFGATATLAYTGGAITSAPVYVRLKAGLTAGNYNSQSIAATGGGADPRNVLASGSVTIASPPTLIAASGATVEGPFDVTFTDNSLWRSGITAVTVNGTPLTAGYTVSAGTITFTPAASLPEGLLQTAGSLSIVVQSASFTDADVTQALNAGVTTHMAIATQPTGPAANGSALNAQPVIQFRDLYENVTSSTATVTAAVGFGTWTLGGTTAVDATAGTATFAGLTATSTEEVTTATLVFSSPDLTDVSSDFFTIIAPPPANDNPAGAISLTPNSDPVQGTFAGSTPIAGAPKNDVWYSFTAVGSGATVTVGDSSPTSDRDIYVYSAPPTSYSTTVDVIAKGTTSGTSTQTATASNFVVGTTYYILVQDYTGNSGTFNISISNPPDAPTTLAATSVDTNAFTANWNAVANVTGYRVDVYQATPPTTTDLIFSEYVEGGSNNKYVEIYNGTGAEVDLSDYQVRLFANGSLTFTSLNLGSLSGGPATLAHGASIVLKNTSAALTLPSGVVAYGANTVVNFNGDDALALYKVSTAANVDIFGVIGNDPGSAWTDSGTGTTTADKTLRRKSTVTSGVTVNPSGTGASAFTTLATEWDQANIDTVSGLGSHQPVRNYLAGFQNVDAGTATSLVVTGAQPETEYHYVVRAVAGSATSFDSDQRAVTTLSLPPTGYDEWNDTIADQTADQDYDGDGLDNGTEYFMGTAGDQFTANPGIVSGAVTWPRATDTTITAWRVEVSTDLSTWEDATVNYAANLNTSNAAQVVFTMPTTPGKFFVRLMVQP